MVASVISSRLAMKSLITEEPVAAEETETGVEEEKTEETSEEKK